MRVVRIPVLCWTLPNGWATAVAVDDFESTALAPTPAEALSDVKAYLAWLYREHRLNTMWAELSDIDIENVKVPLRPEHRVRKNNRVHVFPGRHPVSLDVAAVFGRMSSGVWLCSLPQVQSVFYFYERAELKDMVIHVVQESFKGQPPDRIYSAVAAERPTLDEIVLQTRSIATKPTTYRMQSLARVAEAVADLRRSLSRAFEREDLVAQVVQRLKTERSSLVLVGEAGCGKTAVLIDAVRSIERTNPDDGPRRRFWLTRGARLVSGMRYLGQWEERMEKVIGELSDAGAVLCIESLLELVSVGGPPQQSVGAFLVPYLQRGELRIIAEASPSELEAVRRLLPALADALHVVRVEPMELTQTLRALESVSEGLEQKHRAVIRSRVREQIVSLFRRFMPYRALPGAASNFLRRLVEDLGPVEVGSEEVLARFIRDTGLPSDLVRDEVPLSPADVVSALRLRVIGQEAACAQVSRVVVRFKAGLNDPRRPLGVLFFSGPTGVGKTELARALADYLFGHGAKEDRLIRLDMSEYSTHGSEQRLLVDSHGEPSKLIRRLREQPFVVLLLDEIEKAAPGVFDILLSMLDEGRLTDPLGRLTTVCSAVVIMTSNVGEDSAAPIGLTTRPRDAATSVVARFFRPEFYNRLDVVVGFAPLNPSVMRGIVFKELESVSKRDGLVARHIHLDVRAGLVEYLATAGYDARYGARPLQRLVESTVVVPVARFMANHPEIHHRTLHVEWDGTDSVVSAAPES